MISNRLGGQPLPADPLIRYTAIVSKYETAWAMLEDVAAGLPLPARSPTRSPRPSGNFSRPTIPTADEYAEEADRRPAAST